MTRFCSRRLIASATPCALVRTGAAGASPPAGRSAAGTPADSIASCIEPDWSMRNRKQEGFERLISALYAIAGSPQRGLIEGEKGKPGRRTRHSPSNASVVAWEMCRKRRSCRSGILPLRELYTQLENDAPGPMVGNRRARIHESAPWDARARI